MSYDHVVIKYNKQLKEVETRLNMNDYNSLNVLD